MNSKPKNTFESVYETLCQADDYPYGWQPYWPYDLEVESAIMSDAAFLLEASADE